eukprot:scaffold292190_cov39-Tisochrysis_lutea.AAC.1
MKALSKALSTRALKNLVNLNLGHNRLGSEGMKILATCKEGALHSLITLDLSENNISNEGLAFAQPLFNGTLIEEAHAWVQPDMGRRDENIRAMHGGTARSHTS